MTLLPQIRTFVDQVARRFRPQRIILFGSHAYGRPTPDSDVDLLVVMPDSGDPLGKAIEISRAVPHYGFALDLVVRDPDVLRWRTDHDDFFLQEAVSKGKVLYEDQHVGVGREG